MDKIKKVAERERVMRAIPYDTAKAIRPMVQRWGDIQYNSRGLAVFAPGVEAGHSNNHLAVRCKLPSYPCFDRVDITIDAGMLWVRVVAKFKLLKNLAPEELIDMTSQMIDFRTKLVGQGYGLLETGFDDLDFFGYAVKLARDVNINDPMEVYSVLDELQTAF